MITGTYNQILNKIFGLKEVLNKKQFSHLKVNYYGAKYSVRNFLRIYKIKGV